jgi:hypothetical protein
MCGFIHSTFVTAPVKVAFFVSSYFVLAAWCADAICAMKRRNKSVPNKFRFISLTS